MEVRSSRVVFNSENAKFKILVDFDQECCNELVIELCHARETGCPYLRDQMCWNSGIWGRFSCILVRKSAPFGIWDKQKWNVLQSDKQFICFIRYWPLNLLGLDHFIPYLGRVIPTVCLVSTVLGTIQRPTWNPVHLEHTLHGPATT